MRLEVFQFNSSLSFKVTGGGGEITNRLDELFRSRVILAPGDEERWTIHQSCVCPVMRNVLRLRFKMSQIDYWSVVFIASSLIQNGWRWEGEIIDMSPMR